MRIIKYLIVTAFGLAAISAMADRERPKLDTDGDGLISLPEIQEVRPELTAEKFTELDANADGYLERSELRGAMRDRGHGSHDQRREEFRRRANERAEEAFADIDADGNGNVSQAEFSAAGAARIEAAFARMDENNDGELSADEFRPPFHDKGGRFQHEK